MFRNNNKTNKQYVEVFHRNNNNAKQGKSKKPKPISRSVKQTTILASDYDKDNQTNETTTGMWNVQTQHTQLIFITQQQQK